MTEKVKFPTYFRVMGGINTLVTLVSLLVAVVLAATISRGSTSVSAGAFYTLAIASSVGIVSLLSTINWLFGLRGAYACLFIQILSYLVLTGFLIHWFGKIQNDIELFIVLFFLIFFHLAFLVTGIFLTPVRKWVDQFPNRSEVAFNRSVLISGSAVSLLLPASIFLMDKTAGRDVVAMPYQIENFTMSSAEPRNVIDGDEGTYWSAQLTSDFSPFIRLNYTSPEMLRKIAINGTTDTESWKSHNRLKEVSLQINDSVKYDFTLQDAPSEQFLEFEEIPVTSITLVPKSFYPGLTKSSDVRLSSFKPIKRLPIFEKAPRLEYDNVYVVNIPAWEVVDEKDDEDLVKASLEGTYDLSDTRLRELYTYVADNWSALVSWRDMFYAYGDPLTTADGQSYGKFFGGYYTLFEFEGGLNEAARTFMDPGDPADPWEMLSGIPFFTHHAEAYSTTDFSHVNGTFATWASVYLIPEPDDEINGLPCQEYYDKVFSRLLRMMLRSYMYLENLGIENEAQRYSDAMGEDFYAPEYLHTLYGNALDEYKVPGDHTAYNEYFDPPDAMGFWLRRELDGSSEKLWEALRRVMKKYDYEWYESVTNYGL